MSAGSEAGVDDREQTQEGGSTWMVLIMWCSVWEEDGVRSLSVRLGAMGNRGMRVGSLVVNCKAVNSIGNCGKFGNFGIDGSDKTKMSCK